MSGDHKVPYAQTVETVLNKLNSQEDGLSDEQVSEVRQRFGENQLPIEPSTPAYKRFFRQFHNVLIYVLIASGLLSAALQHYVDCGVILAVVVVNAIVGFVQEGKAEDALRSIMSMTQSKCLVVRDGELKTIASIDLVPGDVVMLQAGDRVSADMRLFYCKDLRCDESALTGEAQPVSKQDNVFDTDTPLAERKNMAYMGTMVTYGVARGVVTHTGLSTELGQISAMVQQVGLVSTPLQQQLSRFAHQLTIGIVFISIVTWLLGVLLHGDSYSEMFQAAIGIAVSSIPEGLPAIVTIALAIGVQRMAKSNALVRRLPSVEVLGSVDVICSDKTGTLTANAMTAREVYTHRGHYTISGEGYKPEGAIEFLEGREKVAIDRDACFSEACRVAMLCNDANLEHKDGEWVLHGDPTEGALLTLAMKHGLVAEEENREWTELDQVPFESEKRYMATLHHNSDGLVQMMVKGAPERLISFASHEFCDGSIQPIQSEIWSQTAQDYAQRGMRVMALAIKKYQHKPDILSHHEVESGLMMVALVGISDPPRPEAIESIALCHAAGVRVKMITGDSPVTAAAIGNELGLNTDKVLTGKDIDELDEQTLPRVVETVDIFARTSPANKLQLVGALQKNHHVVAMTGDGVNDAPALKQANIGVAMGLKGTDAAKEAADFVLTDDNFSTIAKAVKQGRTVYDNIVKSIIFILPTNLAEALVIFLAIMMGRMMPITPAQVLWVNMITAVTLALALAFERSEENIMQRPPRKYDQGLFSLPLLFRMLLVGGIGAGIIFLLFAYYRNAGASIEFSRTIAVNALVLIEVFYLFNCRFLNSSIFDKRFMKGAEPMYLACLSVIGMQLVFSYLPVSQSLFGLETIGLGDWLLIILCAMPVLFLVEFEKYVFRRLFTNENARQV